MRNHPSGVLTCRQRSLPMLVVNIVLYHPRATTQRLPCRIQDGEIPLEARSVAVPTFTMPGDERPPEGYDEAKAQEMLNSMKGMSLAPICGCFPPSSHAAIPSLKRIDDTLKLKAPRPSCVTIFGCLSPKGCPGPAVRTRKEIPAC